MCDNIRLMGNELCPQEVVVVARLGVLDIPDGQRKRLQVVVTNSHGLGRASGPLLNLRVAAKALQYSTVRTLDKTKLKLILCRIRRPGNISVQSRVKYITASRTVLICQYGCLRHRQQLYQRQGI
jgi:hypothetical protein